MRVDKQTDMAKRPCTMRMRTKMGQQDTLAISEEWGKSYKNPALINKLEKVLLPKNKNFTRKINERKNLWKWKWWLL